MSENNLHYFRPEWVSPSDVRITTDVCVYGATSAGVVAAVTLSRLGHRVVLLNPGRWVGGLTTGGLGWTDYGKRHVVGGMARGFYRAVADVYRSEGREPTLADEQWMFEPHTASAVFDRWLREAGVEVMHNQYLNHATVEQGRITQLSMLGGLRIKARVFIDTTYEGDLMAAAGVPYHIGRESNATLGEIGNGMQVRDWHQFNPVAVDPYVKAGDPSSGLLPYVEARDLRERLGQGDHKIQAYNFRVCMTDDPALKLDWQRPEHYDPLQYELAARWFAADVRDGYNTLLPGDCRDKAEPHLHLLKYDVLPVPTPGGYHKTDTNNHGPVSSDFIGANHAWPAADYAQREVIFQSHVNWQQGFYWFLANDERVPTAVRTAHAKWGLARDEFTTSDNWTPQLYIREARRMASDYLLTEHDCLHRRKADDPVAMGSYTLDSHNCCRFVGSVEGKPSVMNEGDVQVLVDGPYGVSYRSIVPPRSSVNNLLVPVCIGASHIAFGSVRMEPVFMAMAESAAYAASLALRGDLAVQDIPYAELRRLLDRAEQVVELL